MKNLRLILLACILGAGIAACSDSRALLAPEGPRFDSGPSTARSGGSGADTTSVTISMDRGGSHTVGSGS